MRRFAYAPLPLGAVALCACSVIAGLSDHDLLVLDGGDASVSAGGGNISQSSGGAGGEPDGDTTGDDGSATGGAGGQSNPDAASENGGSAGSAGLGGAAGSAGTAGNAGAGGNGGAGGSAGAAGGAGAAGSAGTAGAAGSDAGVKCAGRTCDSTDVCCKSPWGCENQCVPDCTKAACPPADGGPANVCCRDPSCYGTCVPDCAFGHGDHCPADAGLACHSDGVCY